MSPGGTPRVSALEVGIWGIGERSEREGGTQQSRQVRGRVSAEGYMTGTMEGRRG